MTAQQSRARLISLLTVLVATLMIAVGGLIIAVIALSHDRVTSEQGKRIAQCIDVNLGTRNAPSTNDAKAHIAFARALDDSFLPSTATAAQRDAAAAKLKAAADAYVRALLSDQQVREAHPLGHC